MSWLLCAALPFVLTACGTLDRPGRRSEPPSQEPITLEKLSDRVQVRIGNEVFTEYVFTYASRPYFYPVYGPDQTPMTRNWPMKNVEGEEQDHPHQRSLWFAHGSVNGIDFWSEQPNAGRVIHRGFHTIQSGSTGILKTRNDWVDKDGKAICTDERTMRFSVSKHNPQTRVLDFEVTLHASEGDLIFGDTKEGTMGIRIAESMRVKGKQATGHIVNSKGLRDNETWGKRAAWCDYYGEVGSNIVGIAILDHPSNPRHPTWWHVRDYGLFAANPFGQHDFEKLRDKQAGALKLKRGEHLQFKYRFLFHAGEANVVELDREFADYAAQAQ